MVTEEVETSIAKSMVQCCVHDMNAAMTLVIVPYLGVRTWPATVVAYPATREQYTTTGLYHTFRKAAPS